MADVNTGTNGVLRMSTSVVGSSATGRWHDVAWSLTLSERSPSTFGWANGTPAAVEVYVGGASIGSVLYSGSFNWDFRPAGQQSVVIAAGTYRVNHNANGTAPQVIFQGRLGGSGTTTIGGPTSVDQALSLPTLTVLPNTPTSCSAARVSDSSVTVSWAQSHPSNGQPSSNTVRRRINGGAWANAATISPTTSASIPAAANQKLEYAVRANNSQGSSAWSNTSAPVYTSPAAPTGVSATKDAALDITIGWTPRVGFSEHQHQVEVTIDGGATWTFIATVPAGTSTYKDVDPDPGQPRTYRVRARNTAAGNLASAWVQSNSVQLLAPPNAPTLANIPTNADKAEDLVVVWTHNPVDTTPQTAYEVEFSTNGGASYSTTGKVASATSQREFAADSYAANDALTVRVRTWGEATTGGADGEGASPWSTIDTVTFKTRPVVTIVSPADASTWEEAQLTVELDFAQAEGAAFVQATIVLSEGSTVLETMPSTTLASTAMATRVENGDTYTLTVTVIDSNGLTSTAAVADFTVAYTPPVAAAVQLDYLDDSGVVQVGIAIPDPLADEAAGVTLSLLRSIDGGAFETLIADFPIVLPDPGGANSVQLPPNLFTNPSFEAASGTVSTPDGTQPVPVGVTNDGEPVIWQSTERAFQGLVSAAFYWPPVPIYPGDDLFPSDDLFPA